MRFSRTWRTFILTYLDDILIATKDEATHRDCVRSVLERLRENGLIINKPEKCVFAQSTLDFLGHALSADGISSLKQCVEAILQYSQPHNASSLQRFLGIINCYHRFVPNLAQTRRPTRSASLSFTFC